MPKVFVVQRSKRRNGSGQMVDKHEGIEKAEQYGELVELLSPTASPFNSTHIINELHDKLEEFSKEDFLLCIGNPALIGWAIAIASYYSHGIVTCLQWSGTSARYIPVDADLQTGGDDMIASSN